MKYLFFFCTDHLNKYFLDNVDIIKYNCFSQKYSKDNINGVIGIYYNENNISDFDSLYFLEFINLKLYCFILLLLYSCIIIYSKFENYHKLINYFLLYSINLFLMNYLGLKTNRVNNDALLNKFNDINSSTLSIAFLISINIFIINFISKKNGSKNIYTLFIIFFSLSLLYLLGSLFKIISYKNQIDVKKILIEKVLFYNLVILINFFIIVIYLIHLIFII